MPSALLWRLAPYLAGLTLILGGLFFYGRHKADQGRAEIHAQWAQQRADQTAAALGTLQAAIERDATERKAREQAAAAANATLLQSVSTIEARVGGIRRQLQEQINADPECARWSGEPVRCDVGWVQGRASDSDGAGAGPGPVRDRSNLMPDAAVGERSDAADQWRSPPVAGLISRPD